MINFVVATNEGVGMSEGLGDRIATWMERRKLRQEMDRWSME